jgi:hypothetical protein
MIMAEIDGDVKLFSGYKTDLAKSLVSGLFALSS